MSASNTIIEENLQRVREDIETAARKSNRRAEDITLVGVTKTVEPERVQALWRLGVMDLGENRPQELVAKEAILGKGPRWHMIGHLQTNKVKSIVEKVHLIQSVDSLHLAREIDKQAARKGLCADILIEINIAGETTKYGIHPEELERFIEEMYRFTNICVKGLMCVAPFVENAEENRIYFEKMMRLYVDTNTKTAHNTRMSYLSMGMTTDYRVAIEEGANMIRIGTGLFGSRQ